MDEPVIDVLATVISVLELTGAVLLILGFALSTAKWAKQSLIDKHPEARETYRRAIGRSILIGLEILVAATILKTITLTATVESMGALLVMVLLRTAIGWTTSLELNGRWPWQQKPRTASASPSIKPTNKF